MVVDESTYSRLEAHRKALRLTRDELCAKSGVKASMIKKYELREKDLSRAAYVTVKALANALEVDPDELIDKESEERTDGTKEER